MTVHDDDESRRAFGLTPDGRVWLGGNNVEARRAVERLLADLDVERPPAGPIDTAFITPASTDEAGYFLRKVRHRLKADGMAWVLVETASGGVLGGKAECPKDLIGAAKAAGFRLTGATPVVARHVAFGFAPDEAC